MSTVENLKSILVRQREVLSNLEDEIDQLEGSDLVTENQNLKIKLGKYQALFEEEKSLNSKISEENKNLRNALYEQFYSEKLQILESVSKRLDVYYKSSVEGEVNRLAGLEDAAYRQVDELADLLRANRVGLEDKIYEELDDLRYLVKITITNSREEHAKRNGTFSDNRDAEFEKLKQENVTEQEIQARIKQNNIEAFIGLNIINKLGVLLLIIGVIAASQYTYFKLPDILKSIFAFIFGIALLVTGEVLNRKKPNVFSLGITSGGLAVLYASLALSFFKFGILDMYPALGLCVLITGAAFVLSNRYNSQTIAAFAMIGGYLPIFSIAGDKTIVYGAMIYFVILNFLALSVSVNRKWTVTAYIGFVLNTAGSLYISYIMFFGRYRNEVFSTGDLITILYIVFAFVIYTLIPVFSTISKKISFKNSDIILLALNTLISTLLLYSVFYTLKLSDYTGLLAIIFAIVYLAIGRLLENLMPKELYAKALFYITGLTFVVLIIPSQFGRVWLSLGWLVEGVALLTYGILKEIKNFKKAGIIISVFCLSAFLVYDISNYGNSLFVYKYLSITAGSIIILCSLIYKKSMASEYELVYKYAVLVNGWVFMMYLIGGKLEVQLSKVLAGSMININFLTSSLMITASFLLAYIIPRINALYDNVIKAISIIIYSVAIAALFILDFSSPVAGHLYKVPLNVRLIGTAELVVISLLAILAVRELILCLVIDEKLGIEWYPFIVTSYFVVILTQNLITQYGLEFNNAAISIIYLVTALTWITFGFIRKYTFIRRFGLGLSILSVAKLFIIDLAFLSQGYKIVAYFIFGGTLIAISFVYQYFSKKIDNMCEVMSDDKKINS